MTRENTVISRRFTLVQTSESWENLGADRVLTHPADRPTPDVTGRGHAVDSISSSLPPNILQKIAVLPSGCWEWRGTISKRGYGMMPRIDGRRPYAHRFIYELAVGPIPDGLQLDHTCHNSDLICAGGWGCRHRRCVNPAHLDPVTGSENTRRGLARLPLPSARPARADRLMTHCRDGHLYDEENTLWTQGGWRQCRQCDHDLAERERLRRLRYHGGAR